MLIQAKGMRMRKFMLLPVCLLIVGLVYLLYSNIAYSLLEKVLAVQCVSAIAKRQSSCEYNTVTKAIIDENVDAEKALNELAGFNDIAIDVLENKPVINTVHCVWCGKETFEFIHYLSVLSVWKMLMPDIIEFHTENANAPVADKYNTWIDEIRTTVPGFVIKHMPKVWNGSDKGCGYRFGLEELHGRGGIYIANNVIVGPQAYHHRDRELSIFYSGHGAGDFVVSMAIAKDHAKGLKSLNTNNNLKDTNVYLFCQTLDKELRMNNSSDCFVRPSKLFPRDIFQLKTNFGYLARTLMYGSGDIKREKSFLPGKIPKIVHYVWFGDKEMDFRMYLSMLSTLFILNPERVIIYTDGHLHGSYMDRITRDKRVMIVIRERPEFIFGKSIFHIEHTKDVILAEVILKYGGISVDWDALWLRDPVDIIQAGYDVVANFDITAYGTFPDTINTGVLMAKPKALFLKRWQDALYNFKSKDFLFNVVQLPYKIYERFPEHIHIERRLQVLCYHLRCHPTFHPDYHKETEDQPFDWRKDAYVIHFTIPDPPELASEQKCKNSSGRFAEIGQFILNHSYKLD